MAPGSMPPQPADSKDTKWVFNPPPGWPVPPIGWVPNPGWQPDSSWPAAPADWKFWRPTEVSKRHRVSNSIKALTAAITLAATITGTYLAYLAIHDNRPTATNWVRQANAACDQDIGALSQSLFNGMAPATVSQQGSSVQSSQVTKAGAMVAAVASLSKLVGDLTALPTPEDSNVPQVQAVLNSGNALVSDLTIFSNAAQDAVENLPGTTISQDLATESSALKQFPTVLVAWKRAIGALSLTRCPFWSRNPNTVSTLPPPTSSPSPSPSAVISLSYSEQQLVGALNPNDLNNCTGRPDSEGGGIVAAVNCQAVDDGPTRRPLVVQFSDIGSAQTWFTNNTVGFVDKDDCAGGYKLGTWTHNNIVAGPLGCSYMTDGSFRVLWLIDGSLIGVIADGSDGPTMNTWWTNSAYVVSSEY